MKILHPWTRKLRCFKKKCTKEEGIKDMSFKEESHEEIYDPKGVEPTMPIDVNKNLIRLIPPLPTSKAFFKL